ncbi:Acyl carrier protein [gamma proteobacterium HdN1]|nr:Acyl carrier protein [gamma proteobacterium HdN1]
MEAIEREIKQLIIDTLDLEDITVNDINSEDRLFGDGLGLDSIDALEIGLALQKRYGVRIEAEKEQTRQHFSSIRALARFVSDARQHKEVV